VLKVLKEHDIEPDIYCGTSVGSFNCAMAAAGRTPDEIEQVWLGMHTSDVFRLRLDPRQIFTLDPRPPLRFALESMKAIAGLLSESLVSRTNWWQLVDLDGLLVDTSPLLALIARNVGLETLRKMHKEIFIALTRLKPLAGDALCIVGGKEITHGHILASCSLPLIFPQVVIGDSVYCDGGVVMNSPLKPAVQAGAEHIYVVDLTPTPRTYKNATLPLAYQVLSTQFSLALRRDIESALDRNRLFMHAHREGTLVEDRLLLRRFDPRTGQETEPKRYRYIDICVFQPHEDPRGIAGFLDFSPENAAVHIKQGEQIARSILSNLTLKELRGRDGSLLQATLPR
jgi:predicted acylesterase/phospholipase RssA